jgi:hypothetical protein
MPMIGCLSCPDGDDEILPEDRRVLIEEFTGVRCVQCPAGSAEILNLQEQYGERLIAISIHAGSLANPYNQSQYNFRTDEGEDLLNFFATPDGFPTAVINRKLFPGQPDLQLESAAVWAGRISSELEIDAVVTLNLQNNWNPDSRLMEVSVTGGAAERISEVVKITVVITENNITDTQIVPIDGIIDDYVHNHVLRKSLTAFDGDILANSLDADESFAKNFTFTLPNEWKAENCSVIAFVHLAGTNKLVLQATEKHLIE